MSDIWFIWVLQHKSIQILQVIMLLTAIKLPNDNDEEEVIERLKCIPEHLELAQVRGVP